MVDIHAHILPTVDDGPTDWNAAVEMCRQSFIDGVTHIVATPHCNYRYSYSRAIHLDLLEELKKRVPQMCFSLGCELQLSSENVKKVLRDASAYSIQDSRYILVEFTEISPAIRFLDPIYPLLQEGLVPIVCHPERNPVVLKHPDLVDRMVDSGCLMQVNANSLTGFWGGASKRMGFRLIKKSLAHFLATDAHDPENRPPLLSAGVRQAARLIGNVNAMRLVCDNANDLVSGNRIASNSTQVSEHSVLS